MEAPLGLMILKTVREYGRLPKEFLYSRFSASPQEIEKQIQALVAQGALKVDGDELSEGAR